MCEKIIDYQIVVQPFNCGAYKFESDINDYLQKGYELWGNTQIINVQKIGGLETFLVQSLVKWEKEEKKEPQKENEGFSICHRCGGPTNNGQYCVICEDAIKNAVF